MSEESNGRLNIYVTRALRRRVKQAAAAHDISISEYCARAIEARLRAESGEAEPELDPIAAARRFRRAKFGRTRLEVSTAELLREVREDEEAR